MQFIFCCIFYKFIKPHETTHLIIGMTSIENVTKLAIFSHKQNVNQKMAVHGFRFWAITFKLLKFTKERNYIFLELNIFLYQKVLFHKMGII